MRLSELTEETVPGTVPAAGEWTQLLNRLLSLASAAGVSLPLVGQRGLAKSCLSLYVPGAGPGQLAEPRVPTRARPLKGGGRSLLEPGRPVWGQMPDLVASQSPSVGLPFRHSSTKGNGSFPYKVFDSSLFSSRLLMLNYFRKYKSFWTLLPSQAPGAK